ncbi:hypothetical protein SLE2022_267080 [Rubroshorea leprosula]
MFAKIVTIGEITWTPATSAVFPEQDASEASVEDVVDLDKGNADSDEVNIMATKTQKSNEERKNTIGNSTKGTGKKVKSRVQHTCKDNWIVFIMQLKVIP